ncbi:MAG: sodium:solute symporter family protein [Eubacteriales bacterium]|nr:sodium:solute symporter family protein [Eubacteriales bacterium]
MSAVLKIGVIIGYVAIISFIATYLGKGNKTYKDFAIGGSKIPWYVMGGTLFSTFCGGATMVAYVGNFYSQGMIWIWIPIQVVLVGVIYLFLYKKVFNLRQVSTADIMTLRYGEETRLISTLVVLLAEVGMASAMLNTWTSMVTTYVGLARPTAMLLGCILFFVTAALGGYKGVATTDAIQGAIIMVGLMAGAFVFVGKAGGLGAIAEAAGPEKMSIFSTANGCSFITILGTFVSSFGMHMALQSGYVSRINSVATPQDAKRGIWVFIIGQAVGFGILIPIIGLSGNVLLAEATIGDSVIGTLIDMYMPNVIALIYVAAIVSAVLTTANSSLLSASICVTNDIYGGMINKNATDKQKMLVSRLSIIGFIILAVLLTTQFKSIISMMFVNYTINALIAIPLFAGLYGKKGGSTAANLSLILGAASVIIWLLLGTPFGIHVAIIGLPMAGIGYLIGMKFGKKPTAEQLQAVEDAGMKMRS